MEIKRDILAKWKALYVRGDYLLIGYQIAATDQRLSQKTCIDWVRTALRTGITTDRVYQGISKYYNQIEKQLSKQK